MFIIILIIVLLFFLFRIRFLVHLAKKSKTKNTIQLSNNHSLEEITKPLLSLGEREKWALKQKIDDDNRKTLIFFANQKPFSRIFSLMAPNKIEISIYSLDDKIIVEYSSELMFGSRSFLNFGGLGMIWGTIVWGKDRSFTKTNATKIEKTIEENFPDSQFKKNADQV